VIAKKWRVSFLFFVESGILKDMVTKKRGEIKGIGK
tara:strand:+ start:502 stop:609 length:108 start_codon:yes stop_codon:yes gene_type:complete